MIEAGYTSVFEHFFEQNYHVGVVCANDRFIRRQLQVSHYLLDHRDLARDQLLSQTNLELFFAQLHDLLALIEQQFLFINQEGAGASLIKQFFNFFDLI